jgi:hypothetical protein
MTKTFHLLLAYLCSFSLLGCGSMPLVTNSPVPEPLHTRVAIESVVTRTNPPTQSIPTIRPGVYLVDDLADLPLPTSGYELYVIGEPHGQKEVRDLVFAYLVKLYHQAGTRSIILEQIPPVYEKDVNAYVLGERDALSLNWSISADILIDVRKFNDGLVPEDKIRVYLSDLDWQLSTILTHLRALSAEIGPENEKLEMPLLAEFKTWEETEMLALVDEMVVRAGDRDDIVAVLETIGDSIRWQFVNARMQNGEMTNSEYIRYAHIREERISLNVQRILVEEESRPVIALYGGYHAQRFPALVVAPYGHVLFLDSPSWTQRTVEAGINIYSVFSMGLSGKEGLKPNEEPVDKNPEEIQFTDGSTVADLFTIYPQANILYIDLHMEENRTLRLGNDFIDVDAGKIYDAAVLFREVHPQEWELYP